MVGSRLVQLAIGTGHLPRSWATINHDVTHTKLDRNSEHLIACDTDAKTGTKILRCLLLRLATRA